MTIKEIIRASSILLNRRDITDYIDNKQGNYDEDTINSAEQMTELVNLVISELSSTYIPLTKTERLYVSNDKIEYSRFSEKVLRIKEVMDDNNVALYYKEYPTYLYVRGANVTVVYEYLPPKYELNSKVGYEEKDIEVRVLAYGLCAEFAISNGRFEEAVTWHKRYVDCLSEKCLPENSYIRARRFM